MKKIFILAAICLGIGFWVKRPQILPQEALRSPQSADSKSSCTGKELCGVIYVAPWCPACKQGAPIFKKMLTNSWKNETRGMQVFVGRGEASQNLEEAISYGPGASADQDSSKFNALGIRQYPSFFVTDAKGKVLKRDQEAIDWIVQNFHEK